MAETENTQGGTVEVKAETTKSPSEFAKFWLQAIELASTDEGDWRKDGEDCLKRYARGKATGFNILYANTQTTVPALYNSEPSPDVRRRFDIAQPTPPPTPPQQQPQPGMPPPQPDPAAMQAMMAFQQQMQRSSRSRRTASRYARPSSAPCRCRASATTSTAPCRRLSAIGSFPAAALPVSASPSAPTAPRRWCEPVQWDDFRHGPGKTFDDWPWVSFAHKLTREELEALNKKIGGIVKLDAAVGDSPVKPGQTVPDSFKRAKVWEVWDKDTRQVYWFAESFDDGPLKVDEDPYELRDFLPIPEPLYQVKRTNTSTPVCEFTLWKALADEVDEITTRIIGLIKVMKAKGLYDGAYAGIVEKLARLDDGELAAADDAGRSMAQGGIDKAIWMWPIETIAKAVEQLYIARDQAKQAVFEFTGVADIQRGQTDPNETLGAQQLKAQWGSLRLQEAQRDVQRYARDLYRLMADLMAFSGTRPSGPL
jgi:hypothetical protein